MTKHVGWGSNGIDNSPKGDPWFVNFGLTIYFRVLRGMREETLLNSGINRGGIYSFSDTLSSGINGIFWKDFIGGEGKNI